MSKRLQVLLEDSEYARFSAQAGLRGLSLAEWVRHALRAASREEPQGSVSKKIAAIRASARYEFPTADIDRMLDEISAGYGQP